MQEPIVLYDIPWKAMGKAWSPNVWKTRFVILPTQSRLSILTTTLLRFRYCLNIKGIPYRTVWVEFPDIATFCTEIGAPPTATTRDAKPVYTLPVIYDPNTKATISESTRIAEYLDSAYPDTVALLPKGPEAEQFQRACDKLLFGIDVLSIMVPGVYTSLNETSQPYFRATREKRFGKLEELAPVGSDKRKKHWEGVKNTFHTIAELLQGKAEQEKLFFSSGSEVSYLDIRVASNLMWIRAIYGDDSKEWQDVLEWDGGRWGRFMDAFRKYEAVDSGTIAKL